MSTVRVGDLPAEGEADARPAWLGREEGHEHVGTRDDAGAFVDDADLDGLLVGRHVPAHVHAAVGLARSVERVAHEVDQQLLDLVGVGAHHARRPTPDGDAGGRFECHDARHH